MMSLDGQTQHCLLDIWRPCSDDHHMTQTKKLVTITTQQQYDNKLFMLRNRQTCKKLQSPVVIKVNAICT